MTTARRMGLAVIICMAGALGYGSVPGAAAGNLATSAAPKSAARTAVIPVSEPRGHHRRRVVGVPVYPPPARDAPGCPGLRSWNPHNPDRGCCDLGFAYHGNVKGCAVDLGNGRWPSCDSLGGGAGGGGLDR